MDPFSDLIRRFETIFVLSFFLSFNLGDKDIFLEPMFFFLNALGALIAFALLLVVEKLNDEEDTYLKAFLSSMLVSIVFITITNIVQSIQPFTTNDPHSDSFKKTLKGIFLLAFMAFVKRSWAFFIDRVNRRKRRTDVSIV